MNLQDLKIYLLNTSAFALSFSNIEMTLKIILLLISIGYTLQKWYESYNNNKK
jgi:hypothetical protein